MMGHFTHANGYFMDRMPSFGEVFQHGHLGIWIFFCISGFVIPYAMRNVDYSISSGARTFFFRRVIRLEPPYVASVLLALALSYAASLTPLFAGTLPEFDPRAFLLQFFYLVP